MKKKTFLVALLVTIVAFFLVTISSTTILAKTLNWRMVSVWQRAASNFEADKKFVEIVEEISGGRIKIQLFAAGELVPTFEVLERCL